MGKGYHDGDAGGQLLLQNLGQLLETKVAALYL